VKRLNGSRVKAGVVKRVNGVARLSQTVGRMSSDVRMSLRNRRVLGIVISTCSSSQGSNKQKRKKQKRKNKQKITNKQKSTTTNNKQKRTNKETEDCTFDVLLERRVKDRALLLVFEHFFVGERKQALVVLRPASTRRTRNGEKRAQRVQ
jgi:uncharacterized membrane-anchored protein